jgi:hypothetical protein
MTDYGTLLRDHVTLRCRCIDRIFLHAYAPKLQAVGDVCTFLRWQRKFPIPSSAAFGKIGDQYIKANHQFAKSNDIPVVHFEKGQDKEETALPYLEAAAREGKDRVVLIGIAQEKASVWRSWPRKSQKARHPHMDWGRKMAFISHFYFYLWDSEWGKAFLENQRLCPLAHLAVAEWPRVGQASVGEMVYRLRGARQWISILPGRRRTAEDLRSPRSGCGAKVPYALVGSSALAVHPGRDPKPATDMTWRFANSKFKFPIPAFSTGPSRAGCGLKESSAIIWTWAARIKSR